MIYVNLIKLSDTDQDKAALLIQVQITAFFVIHTTDSALFVYFPLRPHIQ